MRVWQDFKRFENAFHRHILFPTSAYHLPCDFFSNWLTVHLICMLDTSSSNFLENTSHTQVRVYSHDEQWNSFITKHIISEENCIFLFFGLQPYSVTLVDAQYQNYGRIPLVERQTKIYIIQRVVHKFPQRIHILSGKI